MSTYTESHRRSYLRTKLDPEKLAKRNRSIKASRDRLKLLVIEAYGGKCTCCLDSTTEFLTIDHIDGLGVRFGQPGKGATGQLYRYLRDNGFPTDHYRLMCMNCNFAYGHFRYCPHSSDVNARRESRWMAMSTIARDGHRRKLEVISAYGSQCICCSETLEELLTIDHIGGLNGSGRGHTYIKLVAESYPKDKYRLLCMNCNFAYGMYGHCPHTIQ